MLRKILLAAALAATAAPALADTKVVVNLAGMDAKAAHAKIVRAAEAACSAVLNDGAVVRYYEMSPCISDAVAAAEAKYAANDHRFASVQNTGR